MVLFPVTLIDP